MHKQLLTYLSLIMMSFGMMAQDLPYMDGTINYLKKGDYLLEKGAYVKALKAYAKGAQKNPEDSLQYFSKLAYVTKELNQYEEAEKYYALATTSDPSQEDILGYAEVLAANEKYDEASDWMSKYDGDSELSAERKDGFDNVRNFYADSLSYLVRTVDFNSNESDFSPAYFDGGILFVSGRGAKGGLFRALDLREETSFLDLYMQGDEGIAPFESVNNILHQGPVTYSEQLGLLLVTANHPESSKNKDRGKNTNLRILFFEQVDGEWEEKSEFPHNDPASSLAHPTFDEEAQVLYFASDMPGGQGGVDLYSSKYENGNWSAPVNLGPEVNTSGDEMFPFVDTRQNVLYFSSNGYGGVGGLDVYRVAITGEKRIVNLGYPINSPKDDFGLIINKAGDSGYLSSNREGGEGKDDIYSFLVQRVTVRSKLIDFQTKQPIIGNIRVIDKDTGREVPYSVEGDEVVFDGIQGKDYKIVGDKEGYAANEVDLTAPTDTREFSIEVPIEAEKVAPAHGLVVLDHITGKQYFKVTDEGVAEIDYREEGDEVFEIKNVFFDFDSADPNESVIVIDELVRLLKKYDQVQLEVKAFTDSRGPEHYNTSLAQKRADKIVEILQLKGVDKSRISHIAVGESEIYNDCKEGTECSDEDHALNRRVDFSIEK
ncbi:MAG: OmpA family protein [Cytophagales bacterium]|nr:OmpA family protein [Cytophagales bacterium]